MRCGAVRRAAGADARHTAMRSKSDPSSLCRTEPIKQSPAVDQLRCEGEERRSAKEERTRTGQQELVKGEGDEGGEGREQSQT